LVVGLIAYAVVATFYAVFDLLAARGTRYTVDLLGKAMFRGLRDPSILQFPLALDSGAILWYNSFHLVISLAIGVVVTSLVLRAGLATFAGAVYLVWRHPMWRSASGGHRPAVS
jgi:hypothetical protein